MAQLKERDTDETVDNQLIPEEVERLRELGVDVEESENQDGSGSGGDGFDSEQDEDDPEEEESGSGSGDGEEEKEEQEPDGEEFDNSGLDSDDLDELKEESEMAGDEGGDVSDKELDEQVEAVKQAGGGSGQIRMENFEKVDMQSEWEQKGRTYGRQMGKDLVDHFEQERRTAISHGENEGHFDSNQLIEADRGSSDVFYQRNSPDEKKYHAVIAMDDSGSMSGPSLENACVTTGMLVRALEDAGIDTTVYRFAANVRLVKSSAQSYDECKDKIYEPTTNGGTRLLPAIQQAEEIAKNHADETFLVTVTDGSPRCIDEIKELLQTSNMKSITVQIMDDRDTFKGDYDAWVVVDDASEIASKTKSAFRRVML